MKIELNTYLLAKAYLKYWVYFNELVIDLESVEENLIVKSIVKKEKMGSFIFFLLVNCNQLQNYLLQCIYDNAIKYEKSQMIKDTELVKMDSFHFH